MKKNLPVLIEAAIAGILVFLLTFTNALSSLDYIAKDKLYQSPRGIDSDIKIIGIDEKTLDEYGPIQTWSRSMYADLLNTLNSDENMRPAVIGFDIVFAGNVDDSDSKFAEAVKSSGNVVLVNTLIYSKVLTYDEDGVPHYVDKVVDSTEPYAELAGAAAGIGYSNVSMDSDGTVRRVIPVESYNGQDCSMFSKVLYEEYCRQTGASEKTIKTDKKGRSLIIRYIPPDIAINKELYLFFSKLSTISFLLYNINHSHNADLLHNLIKKTLSYLNRFCAKNLSQCL